MNEKQILEAALKLKSSGAIHFELVAVLPEIGAIAWWNGSCTFQVTSALDALVYADGEEAVPVLAIWLNHDDEGDRRAAAQALRALAKADPFTEISWNTEEAYLKAQTLKTLGAVHVYDADGDPVPETEEEERETERQERLAIVGDEYGPDWRGVRSPWRLACSRCTNGHIQLTQNQYDAQMNRPGATWRCPEHATEAFWDDDWHDNFLELFGYLVTTEAGAVSS